MWIASLQEESIEICIRIYKVWNVRISWRNTINPYLSSNASKLFMAKGRMCAMQICGSWFQLRTIPFRMHHVTQLEQREFTNNDSHVDDTHRFYLLVSIRVSELFIIYPISIQPNPIFERTRGILFPPLSTYSRL